MPPLERLIAQLGTPIRDHTLIQSAVTHRGYINEHPVESALLADPERLEFLGDALLNTLTAEALYHRFPHASEGELTALRTALIRTSALATFARELGLGAHLRLTRGEERSGARERESLLADTFEALIAAVYLDGGLPAVHAFLGPLLERELGALASSGVTNDFKSVLMHRVQASRGITPSYRILSEEGPEHRRNYTAEALVGDERYGIGAGNSKQAAQQAAAQAALEYLDAIEGA